MDGKKKQHQKIGISQNSMNEAEKIKVKRRFNTVL
jgi:hypothetical protein